MKRIVVAATVRSRANLHGVNPGKSARDLTVAATSLGKRCTRRRRRFRFAGLHIDLPKCLPESPFEWVQVRVAWHHRSNVRPLLRLPGQVCTNRVFQDVKRDFGEGSSFPILLAKHVVARLVLKLVRPKQAAKVHAKEHHPIELVTLAPHPHPDEMDVIWHQTVAGTEQTLPRRCVQQQLAELLVEQFVQPPLSPVLQRLRPMHDRVALVVVPSQSGQMTLVTVTHADVLPRGCEPEQVCVAATVRSRANLHGVNPGKSARDLTVAATSCDLTVAATEE